MVELTILWYNSPNPSYSYLGQVRGLAMWFYHAIPQYGQMDFLIHYFRGNSLIQTFTSSLPITLLFYLLLIFSTSTNSFKRVILPSMIQAYLDENLKEGFIQPSKRPFVAPILFIKKNDDSLCLCVDYWGLILTSHGVYLL